MGYTRLATSQKPVPYKHSLHEPYRHTLPVPYKRPTCTGKAGFKTLHKIAVRSYNQTVVGKKNKKRGLITDHFWDGN